MESTKTKARAATRKAPARKEESGTLRKFFLDELKDIYWAEKHLTKALPKMKKAATSEELAGAFADHLVVTEKHVTRLEKVFEMMDQTPQAKKCEAMEGILKEGQGIIEETEDGTATRDVGLILAAQKVEHYEIATYGGLTQLAKTLGRDDVAGLLAETLSEEKEADETLTEIAQNNVNEESAEEGGEENDEELAKPAGRNKK